MDIYVHPTCSTCKKVCAQLQSYGYIYDTIDIRQTPPKAAFFLKLLENGVSPTKMLNTSGQLYKELEMKEKLPTMTQQELAALLSREGMLIKRPVVIAGEVVTFGSREIEKVWQKHD